MRSENVPSLRRAETPPANLVGKSPVLLLLALLLFYGLGDGEVSASVSGSASFEVVDADQLSDSRNDLDPCLPQRSFCPLESQPRECMDTGLDSRPPAPLIVYRSRAPPFV